MKIVTNGAEHQFLTFLEKLKTNSAGWLACTFPFSRGLNHEELMGKRAFIKGELARLEADTKKIYRLLRGDGRKASQRAYVQIRGQ